MQSYCFDTHSRFERRQARAQCAAMKATGHAVTTAAGASPRQKTGRVPARFYQPVELVMVLHSAFTFGAGVSGVVGFGQMLKIQPGIYLCGAYAGMAEHFLYRSQIT